MGRMSDLHIELTEMPEYWIGRDDARRNARRATFEMSAKKRQAYELGYSEQQEEGRRRFDV